MPARLNLQSARKALSTLCQQTTSSSPGSVSGRHVSTAPRRGLASASNAGTFNHHSNGVNIGLSVSTRQQRRMNSSKSDSGDQSEPQNESAHYFSPEEAAEVEEKVKKSDEGVPGSPEEQQGSPISEVSFLFFFFFVLLLFVPCASLGGTRTDVEFHFHRFLNETTRRENTLLR